MRETWDGIQNEYALEFPVLSFRVKAVPSTSSSVTSAKGMSSSKTLTAEPAIMSSKDNTRVSALSSTSSATQAGGTSAQSNHTVITSMKISDSQRLLLQEEDIQDDYRLFRSIERYLIHPSLLSGQTLVEIPVGKQNYLIERYWSLDDVVVKELLSKKKMNTSRQELDYVSSSTEIPLRSVLRQFHNLKIIFTYVEEIDEDDINIFKYMTDNYLLNTRLAKKYTNIVFLFYAKFTLTTNEFLR